MPAVEGETWGNQMPNEILVLKFGIMQDKSKSNRYVISECGELFYRDHRIFENR